MECCAECSTRAKSNSPFDDTRIGLAEWDKHIISFGFGKRLGIDLPNEKSGLVPSPAYYDRAYRGRPWKFSNIYSIAIGEGENLVVPLQMANFAATIANQWLLYNTSPYQRYGIHPACPCRNTR